MAKVTNIDQQQRVVIPPPTKLPPNPHITGGLTSRLLTTPSETDSAITQRTRFEAREDKALRYKLLQFDQRSFITGSSAADLQACQIIDTVRSPDL